MKRILTLVLALTMVLSLGVAAFADTNMSVRYDESNPAVKFRQDDTKHEATQHTDVWLQVAAEGQIDVTVPLVLVFRTNIDGGSAQTSEKYQIINHSTADLALTKIASSDKNAAEKMERKAYATEKLTEDQYKAQVLIKDYTFDTAGATDSKAADEGGLVIIEKAPKNDTENGQATRVYVDLATGRLSFVTEKNKETEEKGTGATGVLLMDVTYTVAINTKNAVGEAITGNSTGTANWNSNGTEKQYNTYTYTDTTVVTTGPIG